jgi:hypothetical protein
MKKQRRFFVVLCVLGSLLFFSGDVLTGPPPLGVLAADFGVMGALCRYNGNYSWGQLATASSNLMVAALGGLVANFPGFGLYQYQGGSWHQLTPNDSAENLLSIYESFYADFGSLGL